MLLCFVFPGYAEEVVIKSFDGNGTLTWSNSLVEGMGTVEWASSLAGPWSRNWRPLIDIPITGSVMTASVPMFYRVVRRTYSPLTNQMAEVTYDSVDKTFYEANSNSYPYGYATYQKGGPEYTFYMSIYEISNTEFCEFLNDAEANQDNELGTNMFFCSSPSGFIYMDSTQTGLELLFDRNASKLIYDDGQPVGSRYSVTISTPVGGGSYSNHPVAGMSWYGAVKYCNWFTIKEGRGITQRCYTEGDQPVEWAPVTAQSWDMDLFTYEERTNWLSYQGFRLPMLYNGSAPTSLELNERYKAAAWHGTTNMLYGFGRNLIGGFDANYSSSGDPYDNASTPCGYYNGSDHGGSFQTRSNENFYGIYDLSGNVTEWTAAGGGCDGCFGSTIDPCKTTASIGSDHGVASARNSADYTRGFRIVSTYP